MDNNENLESSLDNLSESDKLELFKVEELEMRLEMAAISPRGGTTVKPSGPVTPTNGTCNSNCNSFNFDCMSW